MLKCQLETAPGPGGWEYVGRRWRCGPSWIEPFSHPAVEHALISDGGSPRLSLIVREVSSAVPAFAAVRQVLRPEDYDATVRQADEWPLHAMRVELTGGQPVRITCGPRGVAPLHLRVTDGRLKGPWDLLDLDPDPDLDVREATALLAYRTRYSSATIFRHVHRLTERATATWGTYGLSLAYPEPAPHSRPRTLRQGADPVTVFNGLVRGEIAARPLPVDQCAVELSGGMDSTMVALAAAEAVGPVLTAALVLGGAAGAQQARRREEIRVRAGLGSDVTVQAWRYGPFHSDGPRAIGHAFNPGEGTYSEAMDALYAELRDRGVRWVLTGVGGDKLCFQRPEERAVSGDPWKQHPPPAHLGPRARACLPQLEEDLAPASALHASTLAALGVHCVTAMRHGLWPVSPLATPLVLRFAESLPHAWRRDKHLMRHRLRLVGYPNSVVRPAVPENFGPLCEAAMSRDGRPLLEQLLPDLLLAETGLVDREHLAAECARVGATGHGASELYRPLALEVTLRSLRLLRS